MHKIVCTGKYMYKRTIVVRIILHPPPCYRYLKIEKFDATQISDESVKHKETKFNEMTSEFKQVEDKGSKFISDAKQVRNGHDQFRVHVAG